MANNTKTKLTKELIEEIIRISIDEVDEINKKQLDYFISCVIAQYVDMNWNWYLQNVLMGAPEERLLEESAPVKSLYRFHQIIVKAFEFAETKISFTGPQKDAIISNFIQMNPDLMDLPIVAHLKYGYHTDLYVTEYRNGKAVGLLFDTFGNYADYVEASPESCNDLSESCDDSPEDPIHTVEDALRYNPDALCAKIEMNLSRRRFYK